MLFPNPRHPSVEYDWTIAGVGLAWTRPKGWQNMAPKHIRTVVGCLAVLDTCMVGFGLLPVSFGREDREIPVHQGVGAPKPRDIPLIRAAIQGDLEEVRRLLDDGADVNARGRYGCTALHEAVALQQVDRRIKMTTLLLERGADPKLGGRFGETPLHEAARGGGREVIRLLLKYGADLNAEGWGCTPLHIAAAHGAADEADELIHAGARINARENRFGKTPLFLAVDRGDRATVVLLLRRGASRDIGDRSGRTPLARAKQLEREDLVRVLEGVPESG